MICVGPYGAIGNNEAEVAITVHDEYHGAGLANFARQLLKPAL